MHSPRLLLSKGKEREQKQRSAGKEREGEEAGDREERRELREWRQSLFLRGESSPTRDLAESLPLLLNLQGAEPTPKSTLQHPRQNNLGCMRPC